MKRRIAVPCAIVSLWAGILAAGCGSSAPEVTVAITSPTGPQTIEAGQTVNITGSASSSGGPIASGVTWSLSGSGCSGSACGTLTDETGTSVTYQAPATPPPANMTVYVIATAATGAPKSASITITVAAVSVTMNSKYTQLAVGAAPGGSEYFDARFGAQVYEDPANQGVNWSLTANGAPCSPACGTLSGANPFTVQYAPPTTVPAAPNNNPTLTATSISDPTKYDSDTFTLFDGATACGSGGNEGELNGEYAIMLQGWSGNGSTGGPLIIGASFGADGTGKITGGIDQFNPTSNYSFGAPLIPSASSYSVGSDNRGCLALTDGYEDTFVFHFSLGNISSGIASKGDIILFNAQPPTVFSFPTQMASPEWAAGILRLQDPSAFSVGALAANYAIGVSGWDLTSGAPKHFALAGSFAQSGGNLSNPVFDSNDGGSLTSLDEPGVNLSAGTIQQVYGGTGTALATLQLAGSGSINAEVYIINSSELFFIASDLSNEGPVFCGRAIATSSSFTPASIAPSYVFRSTGSSAGVASASIGLLNFSSTETGGNGSSGAVSGTFDQYSVGSQASQKLSGNYGFFYGPGRLVVTGANSGSSPICYLTNPFDGVAAFCISTDSTASLGVMNVQPAATYGNSSLSGNFFWGTEEPGDSTVPDLSGIASISSGNLTGTEDTSGSNALSLGAAINGALSINADGTGTMGANTVLVTNGTEIYFINEANGAPAEVQVFQQQ